MGNNHKGNEKIDVEIIEYLQRYTEKNIENSIADEEVFLQVFPF